MRIHRHVGDLVEGGDKRAYIAAESGFLKAVKVGAPHLPIYGYFIGKTEKPTSLVAVAPQVVLFDHVPVPAPIIGQATTIFRHVYENFEGAEMIVLLRWKIIDLGNGRKIGRYYLDRADRVEVAAAGLDYVQSVPIVGSLHSHANFGAGFSSTDDRWERDDTPGIYITIGNVDKEQPSIQTSVGGLGARKVIPSPKIPKEIFNSVTLSKESLAWWTETLTVKEFDRKSGFYICIGERVMGWTGHQDNARLSSGERIVPVQEYHAAEQKKINRQKFWETPVNSRRKKEMVSTVLLAGAGPALNLNEYRRITNFIKFLKKKNVFSEFMYLMLNQADTWEEEDIIRAIDMHCDEGREEERKESPCGKLPSSDAEESGTTWPQQWDGFWSR